MNSTANVVRLVVGLLMFVVLFAAQPAYAYLDPGTGSFLLQVLIAALVGVSFTIRLYWRKVKELLSRWLGRKQ